MGNANRSRARWNLRLLVATVLVVATAVPLAIYLHRTRKERNLRRWYEQAAVAEREGNWGEAARLLRAYSQAHPQDADTLLRLATASEKAATSHAERRSAMGAYQQLLQLQPHRHDLRLALTELQVRSHQFEPALTNAELVLAAEPGNPRARLFRAQALDAANATRRTGAADSALAVVEAYEVANARLPGHVESAARLAVLYREEQESIIKVRGQTERHWAAEADRVIDTLVAKSEQRAEALLARFHYRDRYQLLSPTTRRDDLRQAIQLEPDNLEVRLTAAESLVNSVVAEAGTQGKAPAADHRELVEAEGQLQQVIDCGLRTPRAYIGLARVQELRGGRGAAIATLQTGLQNGGADDFGLNTRLTELLIADGQWQPAAEQLARTDRLVNSSASPPPPALAERLRSLVLLLSARWNLEPGNPSGSVPQAVALLRRVEQSGDSELQRMAAYRRGQAHAMLGEWDQAAAAYQAAAAGGSNPAIARKAAEALAQSGAPDQAVKELERLALAVGTPHAERDALFALARAELNRQANRPERSRNWNAFRTVVARARSAAPDSPVPVLLDLEAVLIRGGSEQQRPVMAALEEAKRRFAGNAIFWARLADLDVRLNLLHDATQALAKAEALTGNPDHPLRVRLALARRDLPAFTQAMRDAGRLLTDVEQAHYCALALDLGQQTGQIEAVQQSLESLAEQSPTSLGPRLALVQLASQRKDAAALERWENRLKEIEGTDGTNWRLCRVLRLLGAAERGDNAALAEALPLAEELTRARPRWGMAWLVTANGQRLHGDAAAALTAYGNAFTFGGPAEPVAIACGGLVRDLIVKGDSALATRHAMLLPTGLLARPGVLTAAVLAALDSKEPTAAAELARRGVESNPDSAAFALLSGQAQLAVARQADPNVEAAFRTAIELRPGDAVAWISLLHYYANYGQDRSPQLLEALRATAELLYENKDALPAPAEALTVGRCAELEGELKVAGAHYASLLQKGQDNAADGRVPPQAHLLSELAAKDRASVGVEASTTLSAPERTLALLQAARDATIAKGKLAAEPRNAALALVALGGPGHRAEAVALLEKPAGELPPADRRLLSRLLIMDGKVDEALKQWQALVTAADTPQDRVSGANLALDAKRPQDAARFLSRLVRVENRSAAVLVLQARYLSATGNDEEARGLLRAAFEQSTQQGGARLQLARDLADGLVRIGAGDDARRLFATAAESVPSGRLAYAEWLSRQDGHAAEALALCRALPEVDPNRLPTAAVIATRGTPKDEEWKEWEEAFDRALQQKPAPDQKLVAALAILREYQGRVDDAITLTRQGLDVLPDDVVHRNNLAWFLTAYAKDHEGALKHIDRAIRRLGPAANLLDTKGVILLHLGRPEAAIRSLEYAASSGASATTYLHLAAAYAQAGHRNNARQALRAAQEQGLRHLAPFDRDQQTQLTKGQAN